MVDSAELLLFHFTGSVADLSFREFTFESRSPQHKNVANTQSSKANPLLVSSDTVVQMGTEKNTSAEEDNNFSLIVWHLH